MKSLISLVNIKDRVKSDLVKFKIVLFVCASGNGVWGLTVIFTPWDLDNI